MASAGRGRLFRLLAASLARVEGIAAECGVQARRIGKVTRGEFRIQYKGAAVVQGNIDSFRRIWAGLLEKAVEATA